MNKTRVVALLTEADINAVASEIATEIMSRQVEGGEELDRYELEQIVESSLSQLDASRAN